MSPTPAGRIERGETKEQVVGSQKCVGLEQSDLCTECVGWRRQGYAEGLASSFSGIFKDTSCVFLSHPEPGQGKEALTGTQSWNPGHVTES